MNGAEGKVPSPVLGDLAPVEGVLSWLEARLEDEKTRSAEDDRGVLALREVHRRFAEALVEAKNPAAEISIEELAKREGVSVAAIYKRKQRGQLPGARKRAGRLVVPVSALES